MDSADIRELPTVVERLAAMGPRGVRGPHCWFCGKIEAWFLCDCHEALAAQQGKRVRPVFDAKRGVMILDEEIVRRNLVWGFARRYIVHGVDSVDRCVDKNGVPGASSVDSVDSAPVAVDKLAARRAYKAEHERQRRASLHRSASNSST